MNRLRFVMNRRWAGYLGVAVLFAIACVLLSRWQWARLDEVRAENERVAQNWDRDVQPIDEVLPTLDDWHDDLKWTPVELHGRYLADEQLLVRNRPMNGQPGFAVVVPFKTDAGAVFVVDRGWVPTGSEQDAPDAVPAPPAGDVTVVARLKPGEPTLPGRSAPEGQLATVHLPTVEEKVGEPTYTNAYGLLASESPAPAESAPLATPKPPEDEGPHLSYALQWIAFAVMGFIGLGWAVRTEYRIRNADDPKVRMQEERRSERRKAKGPSDAEIEDALIDSHR
ncbi:SURF1 family protein [Ruicaihuangia caeni]|uniref:SURF1-like protein n=1 Tax=Ruicaihuangia caeni TaxID=3042517 RepID=A0AAW6T8P5_9MICO|nr:SURF1 family protein [Klugiella sp. YN-L-19]MDI2098148.1 SURF1 family protein [Klugiella sp. YN-L-19]